MSVQLYLLLVQVILVAATVACTDHKIVLPDDVDVVTIQGNGFNLHLTQLQNIKEKWQKLTDEASRVETPRPLQEDSVRVNEGIFDDKHERPSKFLGNLSAYTRGDFDATRRITKELYDWILRRAEYIEQKYEAYAEELKKSKLAPGRAIAYHILLLNTHVDLKNIDRENFDSSFREAIWIKKKLAELESQRQQSERHIRAWLDGLVEKVLEVERKSRDVNFEWMANMRDLKRFFHEQRFSEKMAQECSDFLGHEWQGISRDRTLELNKDRLSYDNALGQLHKAFGGQVRFQLPFAVQDGILRGY